MEEHKFKVLSKFFEVLGPEGKTFEVRKNDRATKPKVGDIVSATICYILNLADVPGLAAVQGAEQTAHLSEFVIYGLYNWGRV